MATHASNAVRKPVEDPAAGPAPHMSSVEDLVQSFEEADAQPVDISGHGVEDWFTVLLFWVMTVLVFLQFFTRYVMNDSLSWTEELATYCLIGVVFIGASMCMRRCRHIQVDLLYRYLPHVAARVLSTLVDIVRTAFFAYASWLVWRYIGIVGDEPMTTIDWNKDHVYWFALVGFVMMFARSCQVSWENWRRGYSILERPQAFEAIDD
ncbi:TRAP transporter small permease [Cupriavidus plantarum]|uniref:TRAP transporter small permease n=1 Tax=Cupriavidus plantarum TaxID=942865 RepID=UPI000E286DC2|nr:TRAP transporter small permease [Cupriavidus plantarum]REF01690.1 TRAP-type C4-dicarboxylate transport system permease small subunit [Cupriavidus plantarum]